MRINREQLAVNRKIQALFHCDREMRVVYGSAQSRSTRRRVDSAQNHILQQYQRDKTRNRGVGCAPLFPGARGGPDSKGIFQGRPFPTSMLEREQPGLGAHSMQIESSWTPPAKDSTCERGSGQGRVGSKASGACRLPSFLPPDPVPVRKCARGPRTNQAAPSGAHRKMRGTECVHSPAPFIGRRRIAVGGRQSNRPARFLVLDWTTRRTRKKGRNRSRFPPCR